MTSATRIGCGYVMGRVMFSLIVPAIFILLAIIGTCYDRLSPDHGKAVPADTTTTRPPRTSIHPSRHPRHPAHRTRP